MAEEWDYQAARINGDGTIEVIETELPITIESIDRNLSAPSMMRGTISPALKRLKNQGRPVFEPWNTVILAVADEDIRGMTIYRKPTFDGERWGLDQIGLGGYPQGQPYDGEQTFIGADPLDIYRHIWQHLQSRPNGNLGVTIDGLTSPVRVGTEAKEVDFTTGAGEQVNFEAGPRRFALWTTPDLGKAVDDYSKEAPFDWVETYYWQGMQPRCHIKLGHPQIGGRVDGPQLVLDQNMATVPTVSTADYFNEIYVLGAGEGRDSVRGYASVSDGRLRRAKTVTDDNIDTVTQANQVARDTLIASRGQFIVDQVEVHGHPNAPLESFELGNEYRLFAETEWATVDDWVRVVGRSDVPGSDVARLTIVRPGVV